MAEVQEFILPDLGEGLVEATIVEWKVAVGDEVAIDQLVVEVESAKSVVELPTPYAGRVVSLGASEGEVLHAGQVLLGVAPVGAEVPAEAVTSSAEPATSSAEPVEAPAGASGAVLIGYGTQESTARLRRPEGGRFKQRRKQHAAETRTEIRDAGLQTPVAASVALIDERRNSPVMSPLVRREAQAAGFDARHLRGSGPGGLVLRADVQQAAATLQGTRALATQSGSIVAPVTQIGSTRTAKPGATGSGAAAGGANAPGTQTAAEPSSRAVHPAGQGADLGVGPTSGQATASETATDQAAADRRIPVEGMRGIVAEHMAQSHAQVPKATIWLDVDVTPLLDLRAQLQASTGERFSLTTLIARIVVAGLQQHPRLNASFDAATNEIVEYGRVNLGIAAQTPRGLSVPVVHGASEMNLRQLRDGIGELVAEAPRGKYSPSQLQGGTFTLNNYGAFGVDGSSPIINLPQAAMLGIGRLKERPWVVDGELAVRTVMTVSFVFDHRVCDGDAASAFLTYVTDRMEKPALLFADL
ncbi:dihydrolipoamide acetyltransferase family protein [Gulosibacter chungangensis]|nr:dihydrolipoamide acetyltransferase family protein [Gulosibacter chungangensis]